MYFVVCARFLLKIELLIFYIYVTGILGTCLFDKIQPDSVIKSHINYASPKSANGKLKRSVKPFESIRITVDYHDLDFGLTDLQQLRLKDVISKTIAKAQKIFSVQRVVGNLLLSRSSEACVLVFRTGNNSGKCANVRSDYKGEVCIDNFIIPDEHVEGLAIYNEDDAEPVRVIKEQGQGLPDTDFVLYVRSLNTESCIKGNQRTIAYATYCQLDQNNRPIAGYINFCPDLLKEEKYSSQKLFVTALHELFHSLGFSNKLFDKFQDCYSSGSCFDRQDTVQKVLGEQRIVTPKVVEVTSEHFNCKTHETVNEFGPMLEVEESTGKVNSHWDAAFMFSSIMTPSIGLPDLTKVDRITLALFEDTGWYRVDYSQADLYQWGKSGGCDWGRHPQCAMMMLDEECFCPVPGEQRCHYLHRSKGKCETDQYLHKCYVYKTTKKDSCVLSENNPASEVTAATGELYTENSRCFNANLTNAEIDAGVTNAVEGRCYQMRCNGSAVEVKVGDSPWILCDNKTSITVPGYNGLLECPHNGILCSPADTDEPYPEPEPEFHPETSSTTPTESTTSSVTTSPTKFIPDSNLDVVCIEIVFDSVDYEDLVYEGLDVAFREACVSKVQQMTGVKRRRISSVHLLQGSTLFRFDLFPAQYRGDGPRTADVIAILVNAVYGRNFTILSPNGELYVATNLNQMAGGPQVSMNQTPDGVIAAMVVGSVVAALLIGLAVFFVQRYYTIHSQVTRSPTPPPLVNWEGQGQRRNSLESGHRSVSSNISRNNMTSSTHTHAGVVRNARSELEAPQPSSYRRNQRGLSSYNNSIHTGQRDSSSSVPGSRQRSPKASHPHGSNSSMNTDVTRLSLEGTPMVQHQSPVHQNRTVQKYPITPPSVPQGLANSSPPGDNSVMSRVDKRKSKRESAASPEPMLRNTASMASKQSQSKHCIFKCKCAWSNKRQKATKAASANTEIAPQLEANSKHEEKVKHPYHHSVVHCSPVSVRRDFNANVYPQFIPLEDIVSDQEKSNPAASVHKSSDSGAEMPFSGVASNTRTEIGSSVKIYNTSVASNPVTYQPNYFEVCDSNDQSFQETLSSRISHYSSCNSFNDADHQPTHKTCIDLSYSDLPGPNKRALPVHSESMSPADPSVYQSPSTLSHPSSNLTSSGSSSLYPKSSLHTPDPSSIGSSSVKPPGSLFTVNGSHLDLDMSQSTVDTEQSGSVAGATDTDVSYLASTVQLKGQRNSTNSWKSFSSDTSIGSSAVKSKT